MLISAYGSLTETSIPYSALDEADVLVVLLPNSRRVVKALIGDFALTWRASLTTKWLRRAPVARCDVRFLGLPIKKQAPSLRLNDELRCIILVLPLELKMVILDSYKLK